MSGATRLSYSFKRKQQKQLRLYFARQLCKFTVKQTEIYDIFIEIFSRHFSITRTIFTAVLFIIRRTFFGDVSQVRESHLIDRMIERKILLKQKISKLLRRIKISTNADLCEKLPNFITQTHFDFVEKNIITVPDIISTHERIVYWNFLINLCFCSVLCLLFRNLHNYALEENFFYDSLHSLFLFFTKNIKKSYLFN